jgi:type I restriction enzyme M protein
VKEGKNQKTLLSGAEEQHIVTTFNAREAVEDFSVVVDCDAIAAKNWSLSAGQYFEVKIAYEDITPAQFAEKVDGFQSRLDAMFSESKVLEGEIAASLKGLRHE